MAEQTTSETPIRVRVIADVVRHEKVQRIVEVAAFKDAWQRREQILADLVPEGFTAQHYEIEGVEEDDPDA
jgi:hypothetical protein